MAKKLNDSIPGAYEDQVETDEGMFTHGWWLWPMNLGTMPNGLSNTACEVCENRPKITPRNEHEIHH